MSFTMLMPELGESMTTGTVSRWLKAIGDRVEIDEPVLEVSTDKIDTEVVAPTAGLLLAILVGEDETVSAGAELAVIGHRNETANPVTPAGAFSIVPAPFEVVDARDELLPVLEPPVESVSEPVLATDLESDATRTYTPLVRKLAQELGVDLSSVIGTGLGGRVRKDDVMLAANERASLAPMLNLDPVGPSEVPFSPAPVVVRESNRGRTETLSRLRRVIASRMVESLQTTAQVTTVIEADVSRIAELRQRAKDQFRRNEGVALSFLPFFAVAAIKALQSHPVINSSIDIAAGTVTYYSDIHLGIAVDAGRGLMVPVVRDAGDLGIGGLARRIADVADRTRANVIGLDELMGGTFTITNTGSRGTLFDTPILNQPQVAILGTGTVVKRPIVVAGPDGEEAIGIRSTVFLALSYDHRIVDGADAARFLADVRRRLESPTEDWGVGWATPSS